MNLPTVSGEEIQLFHFLLRHAEFLCEDRNQVGRNIFIHPSSSLSPVTLQSESLVVPEAREEAVLEDRWVDDDRWIDEGWMHGLMERQRED